jgi:hypothetical protein
MRVAPFGRRNARSCSSAQMRALEWKTSRRTAFRLHPNIIIKPQLLQLSPAWNSRESAFLRRNQHMELEIKKAKLKGTNGKISPRSKTQRHDT